ncbi:MAG: cohesin domain-containing protein [Saprospiraceae bacterium]
MYSSILKPIQRSISIMAIMLIAGFAAAQKPNLTVEVGPAVGDSVAVNFKVSSFVNLYAFQLPIGWNPAVLELSSITSNTIYNLAPLPAFDINSGFGTNAADLAAGILKVNWFDASATPSSLANGTILFTAKFKIKNQAGSTTIGIVAAQNYEPEAINTNDVNVGWDFTAGNFPSTAFAGLKLTAGQVTGASGTQICVPVTCNGFTNIAAFQFSMNWDPAILNNFTIQNINPAISTMANNPQGPGKLVVLWTDATANGVDLPEGTKLFDICFTITGANGTFSNVSFTNDPVAISVTNGDTEDVPFMGQNGKVTVSGSGPAPCVVSGLTLEIAHTEGCTGDTICMPYKVHNWTGISGLQHSFGWDPSKLQFIDINNITLKDLSVGSFNLTETSNGNIGLLWTEVEADGDTLPSGTTIFELCFKILAADGSQNLVSFTEVPVIFEVLDAEGQPLEAKTCDGVVSVDCSSPSFTINVLSQTNLNCNGVCNGAINISTTGGTAPFAVVWKKDNILLNPQPADPYNLTNLCSGSYVVEITDNTGLLVTLPITLTQAPAIVVNPAITHELCPSANGGAINLNPSGGTGNLSFAWSPNAGFTGSNATNLSPGNYFVTITDGNQCAKAFGPITINAAAAINLSVAVTDATTGQNNGAINLTVNGGTGPYTFDWDNDGPENPDNDPEDLTNLAAGTYIVTVTDANNCSKTGTFVVNNNSGGPLVLQSLVVLNVVSCFGECDGSLQAQASGGSGAITYSWQKGCAGNTFTGNILTGLCFGIYCITVSDASGNSLTSQITLDGPLPFTAVVQPTDAIGELCSGSAFAFPVGGTAPYTYLWDHGNSSEQQLEDLCADTYCVTVTDVNGCTAIGCGTVAFRERPCYSSRKIITPNGDGKNDQFLIECIENAPNILSIYNRWGQEVFMINNYKNNWEGTDKQGKFLPDGAYFYVLRVQLPTGDERIYKGDVSIARTLSY